MKKIAFIGLGHMGAPMAANLVRADEKVIGFDLEPALCAAAERTGVEIAGSANEAVAQADIVITMLPAGRHVLELYGSKDSPGILSVASRGTIFIDCSTISVLEAQEAAAAAQEAGHRALDAPVSGGVVGAQNASLAFMVGGDEIDFEETLPILKKMGKRIVHCGASGLGQAAKMCNNMVLAVSQIAVSEAFVLGEKLGLSHQTLFDVASNASGQCWALSTNCPVPGPVPSSPANNNYEAGFSGTLMAKDLRLAKKAIEATQTQATLGLLAEEIYKRFAQTEGANLDFSAIINTIRDS